MTYTTPRSAITLTNSTTDLLSEDGDLESDKKSYKKSYDVKSLLSSLAPVTSTGADTTKAGTLWKVTTVDAVKRVGQVYEDAFDAVYEAAKDLYKEEVVKILNKTNGYDANGDVKASASATTFYNVFGDSYTSKGYLGVDGKQVNLTESTKLGLFEACLPLKTDEEGNVSVDEDKVSLSSYESAAKAVVDADAALQALDAKVDTWTSETEDKGILNSDDKLSTSTEMWKDLLDLTNSESVVRQILAGTVSKTDISDATKDLDKIYEKGVKAYGERAVKYIKEKYTALHNSADLDTAIKLENAYDLLEKVYGYDASDNEKTGLKNMKFKDSSDPAKYAYVNYKTWLKCESYTSIKNYYDGAAALLDMVASGQTLDVSNGKKSSGSATGSEGDGEQYTLYAFIVALADKVDVTSYCNKNGTTVDQSAAVDALNELLKGNTPEGYDTWVDPNA